MRSATSAITASNSSLGGAPCATSVATRRSAACSPARRSASARASAFAIAVAISSVNSPMRDSTSGGSSSAPSGHGHGEPVALEAQHLDPVDRQQAADSSAIAANSSACGVWRATSVATRCNAACFAPGPS